MAYFAINLFATGYYYADKYKWTNNNLEKIGCVLWTLNIIFFGVIYYAFVILFAILEFFCIAIDRRLHIRFWFSFYMTKKWYDVDDTKLKELNNILADTKDDNKLRYRIFRRAVGLINERNNYKPSKTDDA